MAERVLIIGGAGFIGSRLAQNLLTEGHQVLVYDNLVRGRVALLPQHPSLLFEQGDVLDEEGLSHLVAHWQPQVVFHLAALHYIPYCRTHPRETLRVNLEGTQALLQACSQFPPTRFLFTSSASVYAPSPHPHVETEVPVPQDVYGISKYSAEMLLHRFHHDTGVPCAVVRIFNAYGPNDTNPHLIPDLVRQVKSGATVELGNLDPIRDYVHVDDVSRALRLLWKTPLGYGVFNIGTGVGHSVQEILETMSSVVGRHIEVKSVCSRQRPQDNPYLVTNPQKLMRTTCWTPLRELREALAELLNGSG